MTFLRFDGISVLAPRQSLVSEEMDGDVVIFDDDDGSVHVLNGPAAAVWGLMDGRRSIDVIVETLESLYEKGRVVVRRDTFEFVRELIVRGLLVETPGQDP